MSEKTSNEEVLAAQPAQQVFDAGAFDRFLNRAAPSISEGGAGQAMRRREASTVIDHRICEPGYFDAPFRITVSSLSSADELLALKNAGDQTAIGHVMAKSAVRKMNGRNLKSFEVDMLWEALGFAGRCAVANLFMQHCTGADDALLGKSLSGVEVG